MGLFDSLVRVVRTGVVVIIDLLAQQSLRAPGAGFDTGRALRSGGLFDCEVRAVAACASVMVILSFGDNCGRLA